MLLHYFHQTLILARLTLRRSFDGLQNLLLCNIPYACLCSLLVSWGIYFHIYSSTPGINATTDPVAQAHSRAVVCIKKERNKVVHNKRTHMLDLRGITHKTGLCAYILAPVQPKSERQEKGHHESRTKK